MCIYVYRCWERCAESARSHYVGWQWCRPKFISEQYFLCVLGLGKEVVSLSLVVAEVSRGGGMRWWRQQVGLQISWLTDLLTNPFLHSFIHSVRHSVSQSDIHPSVRPSSHPPSIDYICTTNVLCQSGVGGWQMWRQRGARSSCRRSQSTSHRRRRWTAVFQRSVFARLKHDSAHPLRCK